MSLPTDLPLNWQPQVRGWDRYTACELHVVDLFKKTLIERVNAALHATSRGTTAVVGTPMHFPPAPRTPLRRPRASSSPCARKRMRDETPDPSSAPGSTRPPSSGLRSLLTQSPGYEADTRAGDPTHVLIRKYTVGDNEALGRRLFELVVLAQRAKALGVLGIGPHELSHAALDALEGEGDGAANVATTEISLI